MQDAVTIRLPSNILSGIEKFAQIDKVDRSAEVRKLLEIGIYERKKRDVIDKYRSGKITVEKAAMELGITIWEALDLFKRKKVEIQYDEEDFVRDIEAMS